MLYAPRTTLTKSQSGFSLVELMIATTLSLMLLGAVLQVFLSSKLTNDLTDDISRIQENGRFSLDYLSQNIRMAGYSDQDTHRSASTPIYRGICGSFNPCTNDGGGSDSDRIAVAINPLPDASGAETDCTGANVGSSDLIANVFYITTDDASDISSLTCRGYNITTGEWNAPEQPLIDGIENLQLLYGIDSGTDTNPSTSQVTQFISADQVTNWLDIRAARVGLLVGAGTDVGAADKQTRQYALLDSSLISITDKKIRQIYTATVNIHNAY